MTAPQLAMLIRSWMFLDCPDYALLDALEEFGIEIGKRGRTWREIETLATTTVADEVAWFSLDLKHPVWERSRCPSLVRILRELENRC